MGSDLKSEVIIVAPHFDDEIIGCWEVINNDINPIIIYMQDNPDRKTEALNLKKYHDNIKIQLFQKSIPSMFLSPNNTLYFPDSIYETNPDHRKWGAVGEELLRNGLNVIFYSVNMQAPYIHNVKNPNEKEKLLNKVYPSQKSLWKFDKKYVLFEGKCKWII